jgi:hypothetical protein
MKFLKKHLSKLITLLSLLVLPVISFAAEVTGEPCTTSGRICNPLHQSTLAGLLKTIVVDGIKIGTPIIVLAIIYCGFLFVSARGNPEELTKAKSALLYTLIGAGILFGAWGIAEMISSTVTAL